MDLVLPAASAYASHYTEEEDHVLREIAAYTAAHHPKAHMLSGPVQGAFLRSLSNLIRPQWALDIGTFTGYSALCIATGLAQGGKLFTLEERAEDAAIARQFIGQSQQSASIDLVVTDAKTWIKAHQIPWDLVFLDADKTGYIEYYEQLIPMMPAGGVLLADNVLFHGEVLRDPIVGKNARAIHAFNEHVKADDRTSQVMLTLRDGLLMITKK
jgi:caffeoyl-CoA O-methyltransferase